MKGLPLELGTWGKTGEWTQVAVAQLCPSFCDPMDYSTPGVPVLHCLSEFAQTHIR